MFGAIKTKDRVVIAPSFRSTKFQKVVASMMWLASNTKELDLDCSVAAGLGSLQWQVWVAKPD
jgi:hypothetical protein